VSSQPPTARGYVIAFMVGGGGLGIGLGLYKLGQSIGGLNQAVRDLTGRMTNVELRTTAIEKATVPWNKRTGLPDPESSDP
jgi:hypothetical protein